VAETVTKTTLAAVVAAVRTQIQGKLGFPAERVLPHAGDAADPDPFPAQAEQLVLIHLGGGRVEPGVYDGAARNAPLFRQELLCTLWTRLVSDDPSTAERYLLDQTLGHLKFTDQLWDALWAFQPLDASGNWIVTEALRPEQWQPPRQAPGRKGWGRSALRFTATFCLALDTTYQ